MRISALRTLTAVWISSLGTKLALAGTTRGLSSPTSIFRPISTPAQSIYGLSLFVLALTGFVFVVVFLLLVYAVIRYRERSHEGKDEPPQVYGSNQVETAWTIIPILIVIALFLATGRVIADVQDRAKPNNAVVVTVVGHQFWWEYRYPDLQVVTANELHVPVSDAKNPTPTFLTMVSADTDHSFWVPRLAGKTDLIPNHPNTMWIDPHVPGTYLGECAQFCGVQHAKMLIRVYVQSKQDFDHWVKQQRQPAVDSEAVAQGKIVFESSPCLGCHRVAGIAGRGELGPDLTHLMSRETIAAGSALNTPENLRKWIRDPGAIKPGSLMPALQLSDEQINKLSDYLETLR